MGLDAESQVDVSVWEGVQVVLPVGGQRYELDELLKDVRRENLHAEVDFGPPVGVEVW